MDWDGLVRQWQAVLDANARLGGESSELIVEGPATETEVAEVEAELGAALPGSLRHVLLACSRRVNFYWILPGTLSLPEPFESLTAGSFQWSLRSIADAELLRRYVVAHVLSSRGDPVLERGWDGAFAFRQTDFGDLIAIDLREAGRAPVVTLSHDEDRILDEQLGADFQDFLTRWSALGCPAPEPWLLKPFMAAGKGPLDPDGANARLWRETLGLGA